MTRDPYDVEQYLRRNVQTTMALGDLISRRFTPDEPTAWRKARYWGYKPSWHDGDVYSETVQALWEVYWEKIKDIFRCHEQELVHLEQPHPRAYQRVTDGREFTPAEMLFHYEERKRNPRLEDMQ